jgi:hypothetical protein
MLHIWSLNSSIKVKSKLHIEKPNPNSRKLDKKGTHLAWLGLLEHFNIPTMHVGEGGTTMKQGSNIDVERGHRKKRE